MTRGDSPQTPHREVLVKVNTLVDEGIAPLVEALSAWPEIRTFESCQESILGSRRNGVAFVTMEWGNSDKPDIAKMAVFVDKLATSFAALGWGCGIETVGTETHISMDWCGDRRPPCVTVRLPSKFIEEAARLFSNLKKCSEGNTPSR